MENHRDEFPHLGHDGNRVINELLWQINDNPNNSDSDRAFFNALLIWTTQEFMNLHEAVNAAEMRNMRQPDFLGDSIGRWLDADEYEDD